MAWLRVLGLTLPVAATYSFQNTWGKGKIELYMCMYQPVVSDLTRVRLEMLLC